MRQNIKILKTVLVLTFDNQIGVFRGLVAESIVSDTMEVSNVLSCWMVDDKVRSVVLEGNFSLCCNVVVVTLPCDMSPRQGVAFNSTPHLRYVWFSNQDFVTDRYHCCRVCNYTQEFKFKCRILVLMNKLEIWLYLYNTLLCKYWLQFKIIHFFSKILFPL